MKKKAFLISLSIFLCFSIAVVLCCIFIKPPTSENTPTPDVPDAFYVYDENGDVIKSNANTIFKPGEKYTFTTSYDDFTFAIIPNASDESTDFGFTVNNVNYNFRRLGDLKHCFYYEKSGDTLTIGVAEDLNIISIIERAFPNKRVEFKNQSVLEELERGAGLYFSVKLVFGDYYSVFYLNFGIMDGFIVTIQPELVF